MRSTFSFQNPDAGAIPWYKKKITILIVGTILAAVLVLVGVFTGKFTTEGYRHTDDVEEEIIVPHESQEASSSPKWTGTCPRQQGKCPPSYQGTPPLLLVSLDGFRSDYLKRGFTPTLNKIAKCGTTSDFMYSVFPTKTFPNHYSIVTGLNPESHGIIDNNMFDRSSQKMFKVNSPDFLDPMWYEKEPIWVTATKQGKKTASFYWPGSEVKINGILPTYSKKYVSNMSFNKRVDQILEWLDLPADKRPSFLTLYVNQPDNAGHWNGVNSKQVNQALQNVDYMIQRLFNGLQSRNILNCVNVIIVSDHGMSDIDCKWVVDIKNYIDPSNIYSTMGPFGRIRPKGRINSGIINDMVKKLRCNSEHMRVYPKEQLPVRMHYVNHARIEPIFLDMDSSWTVVSKGVTPGDEICTGGAHGYDNLFPDMRGLFIAHGPSIKTNLTVKPFINTELYELMTELINITPNPNNGTRGSLHHILRSPKRLPPTVEQAPPAVGDVPNSEQEYNFRLYASNCSCSQKTKQVEVADQANKKALHLPFGVPYSSADNSTLRLLYNEDYVSAFDLKYRIPTWTSFNLAKQINSSKLDEACFTGDARIPISDAAKCGDYDTRLPQKNHIFQRPLYPPSFSDSSTKDQALYITNSIPKSLNHTNTLEAKMNLILSKWVGTNGKLNVMMGPAFDLLATGQKPTVGKIMRLHEKYGPLVVPTHIFVIATWCTDRVDSLQKCRPSKLDVNGFLLPNEPFVQNCESPEAMIEKNSARVIDIENLTGLSFFTGLPIYDAIRLRTSMPHRSVSK